MTRRAFVVIYVMFHAIVAAWLLVRIFRTIHNRENVLGVSSVIPIRKELLLFSPDADFDQFYEPNPNSIDDYQPPWLPEKAVLTINSDGLNERLEYAVPKPDGVFRIMTIGDSFTYGQFINTPENWTELMERRLETISCRQYKKIEVINLGVAGYDIQFAAHRFRVRGKKYDPDLVIWLLNDHNFTTMPQLFRAQYIILSKELDERTIIEAAGEGNFAPAWHAAAAAARNQFTVEKITEQENAAFYEFEKGFRGPLVFMLNNVNSRHLALLKIFGNFKKNTYINTNQLRTGEQPTLMLPDRHPNREGHQYIERMVTEYLKTHRLLPCF